MRLPSNSALAISAADTRGVRAVSVVCGEHYTVDPVRRSSRHNRRTTPGGGLSQSHGRSPAKTTLAFASEDSMKKHMLVAAALLLSVGTADAQSRTRNSSTTTVAALIPVDSLRIVEALARADNASSEGRMHEARRIYQNVIKEQVAADEFAGTAMWRLALLYLYSDDHRRAALQLDELAAAAARYGDPTLQLRASFEAAALWQKLRRNDLVAERIDRARALLQSPAIAESEKASIRVRMP
jgi:hypothetical protein